MEGGRNTEVVEGQNLSRLAITIVRDMEIPSSTFEQLNALPQSLEDVVSSASLRAWKRRSAE